jgi:predicted 2-oxoglutarate/Fe(II)-dependent dioxygenase YbiX
VNAALGLLPKLGIFVREGFLEPELCASLRREIAATPGDPTTVNAADAPEEQRKRRLKTVMLSDRDALDIKGRLVELRPELEEHFGLELSTVRTPHALSYREGDFLQAHHDRSETAQEAWVRERKVSVVMFVNGASEDARPGTFSGGDLVFYGLLGGDDAAFGLPVPAKEGLLVAFASDVLHEVKRVTGGERHSVVAWYV